MILRAIPILAALLATSALAIPPNFGQPVEHGPLVSTLDPVRLPKRKSILQLSKRELASLRRGFSQMKAWNSAPHGSANYRRSLQYWANVHAYFGEHCSDPANMAGKQGLAEVSVQQPDPLGRDPWCQCEHATAHFLTWHRMYLYYFERVLQAAAGDASLRLPYWDYNGDGHLPAAYRIPRIRGRTGFFIPNPLYAAARQPALNSGADTLDPAIIDTHPAMSQGRYSSAVAGAGFNLALESMPHNPVHCAVSLADCGSGLMGLVESAGLDPIFYSHHSNIDRLYDCWLQVDPARRLPPPIFHTAEFTFVDGDGSLVRRRVGDMLTSWQLGYAYTAGAGCPSAAAMAQARALGEAGQFRMLPVHGEIRLGRGLTNVPLELSPAARAALADPRGGPKRTLLVLDRITYDAPPGVMYKLYLQPRGTPRRFIGVLDFFNSIEHHHHGGGDAVNRALTLDISRGARIGDGPVSLLFEPTTGLSRSTPEIAARRVNPRANVRIASARIAIAE